MDAWPFAWNSDNFWYTFHNTATNLHFNTLAQNGHFIKNIHETIQGSLKLGKWEPQR